MNKELGEKFFMKQLFIFLQENPTILCYKNHFFKQQDTTFLLLYNRYYKFAVLSKLISKMLYKVNIK